jgi:hypothetical protein
MLSLQPAVFYVTDVTAVAANQPGTTAVRLAFVLSQALQ